MRHQSVLMKDYVHVYNVSDSLFSTTEIAKNHGDFIVDIVHQNPDLYGFVQDESM
jgi:hypothetical protein